MMPTVFSTYSSTPAPMPVLSERARARARVSALTPEQKVERQIVTFEHLKIRTKGRTLVSFQPNAVQVKYLDMLADENPEFRWREGVYSLRGIREDVLKARQQGMSTLWLALYFLDTINTPMTQTLILAHDAPTTEKLFKIVHRFYEHLPAHLKRPKKYSNRREIEFSDIDSIISVGTAGSAGVGRGGTVNNVHMCILGDMKIISKDGFVFDVENPPAQVRDGKGCLIDVVGLSKTPHSGEEMLVIKTGGNTPFPISSTPDHQILTRGGKDGSAVWKRADEMTVGDYVAFPVTDFSTKTRRLKIAPVANCKTVCESVELNNAFGQLCGWYLAEGSPLRNKGNLSGFSLTIDQDEVPEIEALLGQFEGYFTSIAVAPSPDSRTVRVSVYSRPFADFLIGFLGDGDNKRIPDSVWTYPTEFAWGLLGGLLEGDGSFANINTVSFTTTRPQLAAQMKRLALALRIGYPSIYIVPAGRRHSRNCQEQWVVRFHGPANVKLRRKLDKPVPPPCNSKKSWIENNPNHGYGRHDWRRGKDYYWAKVTAIETAPAPEWMYDLVLDKDPHSFCTMAGVVHNSERAFWPDGNDVETGVMESVPLDGNATRETTANGLNEYADDRAELLSGGGQFVPRFFAWSENPEYALPIYGDFVRTEEEEKLARIYDLSDEQLNWRRSKRLSKKQREKFPQEYPITESEAFLSSGNSYFDNEKLTDYLAQLDEPELAPIAFEVPDIYRNLRRECDGLEVWELPKARPRLRYRRGHGGGYHSQGRRSRLRQRERLGCRNWRRSRAVAWTMGHAHLWFDAGRIGLLV